MAKDIYSQKILILDFGSQTTQLIARRVREAQVYCEIHPFNLSTAKIRAFSPKGIILSGGPSSIYDKGAPIADPRILDLEVPVLGICYGVQYLTHVLGGEVAKAEEREYGNAVIKIKDLRDLFHSFSRGKEEMVWMSHGDRIEKMPEGFKSLASSKNSPVAAMADRSRKFFGVQFHPEVAHTPRGMRILKNFLFRICGCEPLWTMSSFVGRTVQDLQQRIGKERVVCGVSGGVDSTITAVLLHKAIGDQLSPIFVDNGLLRRGEREEVVELFRDLYHIRLHVVDASEHFLNKLKGVKDPEQKRKIIGREFITVFEKRARDLGKAKFLAQGTLYPDVIESVSFKGPSATIKSHHKVGGLPQPFPGPGLAVRILGEITAERLEVLRSADGILLEEIRKADLYEKVWQSFAVLLPVKTVGVMGDERTYEKVIALRIVDSLDAMTADWTRVPYEVLARISNRIINEVRGVNRVVYDISSKPPSTIEWE
jgi:GMP synthase (glutamine-hydrolysing)